MQNVQQSPRRGNAIIGAVLGFLVVFVVLLIIALANAPVRTNPRIAKDLTLYLEEVRKTAIPFLIAVGAGAALLGGFVAITLYRVWHVPTKRREMLAGYLFLAPYILVTLTFTIGVLFFAFYVSFTDYGIFTEPTWVGLDNYTRAFEQRDFVQSLHNVLWYAVIVTPTQTAIAILLAVMLNVALATFSDQYAANYQLVLVGAMFNAVPILILFFLFSRYYIEGASYAGVKG